MKVIRSAIIDEEGRRFVEMDFDDDSDLHLSANDRQQFVSFRVDIDQAGFPRLPEAEEEALRSVRGVIDGEIQRLSTLRERGGLA